MRITRLQLRDVRRHADLDLALEPGLTVVRGPNESGKTTIQRALEIGLTRRVTSASADLDAIRRWDAAADARPWIRIEFTQDIEDGTRSGVIEKSFRGAKGTVRLEWDGEEVTDPALADQVLAELTGIPTEAFFRSTASVRHHEVAALDTNDAALRDRLQASLSGADRGTSRARRTLERAIHGLTTRGDRNPGRLKVAEAAVAEATAAVERGEAALETLTRDRDAHVLAGEARAVAERELRELRSLLEKARQAERLTAERNAAQERFERYRQAVAVRDEVAGLQATNPSNTPLPLLRTAVGKIRDLDKRATTLRAMLEGEVDVQFELERPKPASWRPAAILAILAILAGLGVAVAQQLDLLSIDSGFLIGLALVLVGVVLALIGRRQRQTALGFRREQQLQSIEIDRRLRGRSKIEQELTDVELALAEQVAAIAVEDVAAAESILTAQEEHSGAIDRLSAQLDGLVGKEPPETLPGLRDAAAGEIEQKSGALESLGPIAREARARERLETEVAGAEERLERARDEEARTRARVEANDVDAEAVAAAAERLEVGRDHLGALQRRARVYETTLRAIDRAERATMRRATRYLERRMVSDVELVTGGRYRHVRVNDRTLAISVRSPERRDWVDVESLSQGTLDLVYLAARLGLVRLVTSDRRPPLLFDDPFVTLDDDRARRALDLLREISRDFQVIYLTTSDRYDEAADAVRILPGPTAVDDGPPPEPEDEPDAVAAAAPAAPTGSGEPAEPGDVSVGA